MVTTPKKWMDTSNSAKMETAIQFEEIFEEYWSRIYEILFRLVGNPAEAEDLALEAFIRLHKNPRLFGEQHNVGGWLYRVAMNLGYNALRASKRRKKYEIEAGTYKLENNSSVDPAIEAERSARRRQVRHVLSLLKPRDAKMLILRHSGLSYAEVANIIGIAPNSIGTLLARAERDFEGKYRRLYHTDPSIPEQGG